ncbi:MAG TPA: cupin domain-containing protein [Gaiellaceae bacterium]|nr:cupin domain-containing protein [Gaiellaceae bacterium]
MADFAKVNLRELEDMAPGAGFRGIEARFARRPLAATICGLSLQRLAPGARSPFGHRHRRQEELYVIVAGHGRMKLEDEVIELRPFDAVRVAPQTARAFEAGPDGLEFLAFGAPAGDARDAEILQGWWDAP